MNSKLIITGALVIVVGYLLTRLDPAFVFGTVLIVFGRLLVGVGFILLGFYILITL